MPVHGTWRKKKIHCPPDVHDHGGFNVRSRQPRLYPGGGLVSIKLHGGFIKTVTGTVVVHAGAIGH